MRQRLPGQNGGTGGNIPAIASRFRSWGFSSPGVDTDLRLQLNSVVASVMLSFVDEASMTDRQHQYEDLAILLRTRYLHRPAKTTLQRLAEPSGIFRSSDASLQI